MNDTIFFTLAQGLTPDQAQQALERVRGIQGVFNAVAIDPDTKDPVIACMYAATLTGQEDSLILPQIQAVPGVAHAERPAPRGLIW